MAKLPLPVPPATLSDNSPGPLLSGTVHRVWKLGQRITGELDSARDAGMLGSGVCSPPPPPRPCSRHPPPARAATSPTHLCYGSFHGVQLKTCVAKSSPSSHLSGGGAAEAWAAAAAEGAAAVSAPTSPLVIW